MPARLSDGADELASLLVTACEEVEVVNGR